MHKDLLGQELHVGDYIVYAGTFDRSAQLRVGRITKLAFRNQYDRKEPVETVQAKAVQGFWWSGGPKPTQRVVTLGYMDRICKIPAGSVSDKLKEIIELSGISKEK